jgi:hypothetical protein
VAVVLLLGAIAKDQQVAVVVDFDLLPHKFFRLLFIQ